MLGYDFSVARRNMVDNQIRPNRVKNLKLLDAFMDVPREWFVPDALKALSYTDSNIRLPGGRTMVSPLLLARMIEALNLQPYERVLDVACASGYSTAILAKIVHEVVGFEQDYTFVQNAREHLIALGAHHATVLPGDLKQGPDNHGLFDAILIHGLLEKIPQVYLDLLTPTGRLIFVQGAQEKLGHMVLVKKHPYHVAALFEAAVPVLPDFVERKRFSFV